MKRYSISKTLSVLLCAVLIAAMALTMAGCGTGSKTPAAAKTFTFTVVDTEGTETSYEITSDAGTVGEALMAEGLIEGEEGPYGLYVKTVTGITLDYETDGKYWAFYENGAYAQKGVDQTEITDGVKYAFKAE